MCEYPRDRKGQRQIWANKLIRLLQKSCAANEIGIEACWLVTCVALVEDAKHYSGAVRFWTGQLLPITGFQSWGRLDRARERAVTAGWLFYRPGTNRESGVYWSLIPEAVLSSFNDSPVDEVNHHFGDSAVVNHQNGAPDGDRIVIDSGSNRDNAVNLPSLLPVPVPEQGSALPKLSSQNISAEDIATAKWMFDVVRRLQPEHKVPDFEKWANVIRMMRERDGRTDADIRELFLAADGDVFWRKNIRSPDKLRKQWDKLDLVFRKAKHHNGSGQKTEFSNVRNIVKRIWSPDLKNTWEVEAAIGDRELFAAARQTGLSAIADAHERDRDIERTFTTYLQNIRSAERATA